MRLRTPTYLSGKSSTWFFKTTLVGSGTLLVVEKSRYDKCLTVHCRRQRWCICSTIPESPSRGTGPSATAVQPPFCAKVLFRPSAASTRTSCTNQSRSPSGNRCTPPPGEGSVEDRDHDASLIQHSQTTRPAAPMFPSPPRVATLFSTRRGYPDGHTRSTAETPLLLLLLCRARLCRTRRGNHGPCCCRKPLKMAVYSCSSNCRFWRPQREIDDDITAVVSTTPQLHDAPSESRRIVVGH